MTRYRCVAARKAEQFNVTDACDAAGVSRSAFYAWQARGEGPTDRQWDDAHLLNDIIDLHAASGGVDGEPRITAALRDRGWIVNHKRTAKVMREHQIVGWRPRKRRSLTKADEGAPPLPDLVKRQFNPATLDHTWVGDMTYIPTGQGWLYLATVIDLGSRRLLGWSMGDRHDATLVVAALKAAVAARGCAKMDGTIFHHDRGSEYTSELFRQACIDAGIRQSSGRTGSCLDNAGGRVVVRHLQDRSRASGPVRHPWTGPHGHVPLDRQIQPSKAAFDPWDDRSDHLGEPLPPGPTATVDQGRIAPCPANGGKPTTASPRLA